MTDYTHTERMREARKLRLRPSTDALPRWVVDDWRPTERDANGRPKPVGGVGTPLDLHPTVRRMRHNELQDLQSEWDARADDEDDT